MSCGYDVSDNLLRGRWLDAANEILLYSRNKTEAMESLKLAILAAKKHPANQQLVRATYDMVVEAINKKYGK